MLQEFDVGIRDKKGADNIVADHLSRMNHVDDGKEPIEDQMRDDHLYRILDQDSWMNDIIRAIKGMPLDHLDKNAKKEWSRKEENTIGTHHTYIDMEKMESKEDAYRGRNVKKF